jgi:hypothetical protein
MASLPFIKTLLISDLRLFLSGCLLLDLADRYGNIRAHGAAHRTKNTVFGTGLVRREISLRVDPVGDFQNILWTDGHAQATPLTAIPVDRMQILHLK